MARRRKPRWLVRLGALIVLVAAGAAGWAWWQAIHWTPPASEFPVQGAIIGASDGDVSFASVAAVGAEFVYLEASEGADARDPAFSTNLAAARGAGLQVGAIHIYDPCIAAERQAANFVTSVPREGGLLPPAIALAKTGDACDDPVNEAKVESELTTFLNQVEGHAGERALLKLAPTFEETYGMASRMERPLWLEENWMQPDYAGRPWTLWTANDALRSEAHAMPLRWVVVQP